jgi:hypothetical protein
MTTTVQSVLKEVQTALQDESGVRWSAVELAEHLNDGQREIAVIRPEMFVVNDVLSCAAGAKQALPAACINFMDAPRITNGSSIRKVDRWILDSVLPSWYDSTKTAALKHFCYDPNQPNTLYVYPPAIAATSIDIVYSTLPQDVQTPGGAAYSTATGNISVDDIFKNSLIHFCLFRAYSKDAEFGGNVALSTAHYSMFKTCVANDVSASVTVAPKAKS